jgi:hypothetical protein
MWRAGFQSATGATAAIYAQIKKMVGNVPNTFAVIGGPLRSRRCLQPAACPTSTSSSNFQPDMLRLLQPA